VRSNGTNAPVRSQSRSLTPLLRGPLRTTERLLRWARSGAEVLAEPGAYKEGRASEATNRWPLTPLTHIHRDPTGSTHGPPRTTADHDGPQRTTTDATETTGVPNGRMASYQTRPELAKLYPRAPHVIASLISPTRAKGLVTRASRAACLQANSENTKHEANTYETCHTCARKPACTPATRRNAAAMRRPERI
jgi:hypothetical protein